MAVRGTSLVKVVGLPQIAKKLDQVVTLAESKEIVGEVGTIAKTTLLQPMPSHWGRPRQVSLQTTENSARVSMPRYPYIFFERGSSPSRATRTHRTKTAAQFKAAGYRIRPRRYIARTRAVVRKEMRRLVLERGKRIERVWSA